MVLTEAEAEARLAELRRQREAIDRAITDLTLYLELGRRLGGTLGGAPEGPAGAGPDAGFDAGYSAGYGAGHPADRAGAPAPGGMAPQADRPDGRAAAAAASAGSTASIAPGAFPAPPRAPAHAPAGAAPDAGSARAPGAVPPPAPSGDGRAGAGEDGSLPPAGGSTAPLAAPSGPPAAPPAASGLRVPMAEAVRMGADAPGLSEGVLARRYGRALVEAAVAVVEEAGRPLHASEIWASLSERGFSVPGPDPVAALNTRLWKRSGPGGPLRRLGEAVYALGEGDAGLWRFGRL